MTPVERAVGAEDAGKPGDVVGSVRDERGAVERVSRDRHSLQGELNRRHNLGLMADIRGGWRAYNTALHEVRRRLLGIDGPNSWGGCPIETQARLIRYIVAHRAYPQPRLP